MNVSSTKKQNYGWNKIKKRFLKQKLCKNTLDQAKSKFYFPNKKITVNMQIFLEIKNAVLEKNNISTWAQNIK